MKSIKKTTLVALVTILSVSFASAQVGIQAGYSSSKSNYENSKAVNGFHVGPIYNMTIQGPISLQYGLLYNFGAYTFDNTIGNKDQRTGGIIKTTAHHIEIPVRVAASFPVGNGLSAFVFGGPNFDFGLAENAKTTLYVLGEESEPLSGSLYDDKNYSRFNLQLGAGAGIKFNNIGVKFSYDFGLLDMNKSDIDYKVNGLKIGLFYTL